MTMNITGRKAHKTPQEEMNKLEEYLKAHNYNYVKEDQDEILNHRGFVLKSERHKVIVNDDEGNFLWDAISHYGSYGYEKGLLEIYGSIVTEEDCDTVVGWLTAQDVINRLEKAG